MRPHAATEIPALEVLLDEARRVEDARAAARCLDRLSWLAWVTLDGARADRYADESSALRVSEHSPEAFRLAVRRASDELQRGDAVRALATLDAAERAGDSVDLDAFVSYLSIRGDVLCALGAADAAIETARLADSIAQKRSDGTLQFMSALYLAYAFEGAGAYDESQAAYDRAAHIGEAHALGWKPALAQARAAWVAMLRGDVAGARERLARSLRAEERTQWLRATQTYVGIELGLHGGDDSLVATFDDTSWIERVLASRDAYSIGRTLTAFFDLEHTRGNRQNALALVDIALRHCNSAACLWQLFGAIARYGDDEHLERARVLLAAFPLTHPVASAHRRLFEAVLAERRGDAAAVAQRAGEAYVMFDALGARFHATSALVVAGRLTEARARFASYGFLGTEKRVARRAARGRPRLSYEGAQQRREVLTLLLSGRPVKEIARQLGLSERTIKSRISEIYARTGTKRRSDLSASMLAHL